MTQNHLDRLAAPKSWILRRKEHKWTARPIPGPHGIKECITLNLLLKELLKLARTTREVQSILYGGMIKVDGIIRKDYKFPVGLMDVITVDKIGTSYRMLLDNWGRFYPLPIAGKEINEKLLKIINKTKIKGGKIQITFHDGKNILVDKFEGYVGDSALFDLNKKSVLELLKLEKGALVYLTAGKHVGKLAHIRNILKTEDLQKAKVVFEENGEDIITLMDYAFVVGKDKSVINIESKKSEISEKPEKIEKSKKSEISETSSEKSEKDKNVKKPKKEGKE